MKRATELDISAWRFSYGYGSCLCVSNGTKAVDILRGGGKRIIGHMNGEFVDYDINEALEMKKTLNPIPLGCFTEAFKTVICNIVFVQCNTNTFNFKADMNIIKYIHVCLFYTACKYFFL